MPGRHPARDDPPDGARVVRDEHAVHRLDPVRPGGLDVRRRPGAQEQGERLDPEVAEDPGRRPQREPDPGPVRAVLVGAAEDERAARGHDDLDVDLRAVPHLDPLPVRRRLDPLAPVPDEHPVAVASQVLEVEVLVVGHRVRQRPRRRAGVPEVLDAGDSRERQPHDVERVVGRGADEVHLLVDARCLDDAVRVAGDERPAGGRPVARHGPRVAAGGLRRLAAEQGHGGVPERGRDVPAPQLGGVGAEECVLHCEDAERGPRLPRPEADPEGVELRTPSPARCRGRG